MLLLHIEIIIMALQWVDSIDDSPEGITNHASRLRLPSPKRKIVSPLKKYEIANFARRRKVKRWTLLEEETLRTGVQKYVLLLMETRHH